MSSRESRCLLSQDPPTSAARHKSRSWRKTLSLLTSNRLFRTSHSAPASFVSPPAGSSSHSFSSPSSSSRASRHSQSSKSRSRNTLEPPNALYNAVASGDISLVSSMIAGGLTRHQARYRGVKGYTPLHLAVISDRVCLVEALLENHQIHRYINETSEDGRAPLHLASERSLHMARLLINAGAYPQLADEFSWTPLLCASKAWKTDIVRSLITAGASPTVAAIDSATALHSLVRFDAQPSDSDIEDRCDVIRELVELGCSINQQRSTGDTALHCALAYHSPDRIIKFLLELGADPSIPNKSNVIPGESLDSFQSTQSSPYTIALTPNHSITCWESWHMRRLICAFRYL